MKLKRIMSQAEASGLSVGELLKLRRLGILAPVVGGESTGDPPTTDPPAAEEEDDDDDDDDDDDKKDDKDEVRLSKNEYERLRRENAEMAKEKRQREKDEKKEREQQQREQGRYQELAEEREQERDEARRERDEARAELAQFKRNVVVERVAKRLMFRDASDAVVYLPADVPEDEKIIESKLKTVLREKPYLKAEQPPTGGGHDGGDGGGGSGLTMDQIRNMSEDEINRRWKEVQPVLQRSGQGQ